MSNAAKFNSLRLFLGNDTYLTNGSNGRWQLQVRTGLVSGYGVWWRSKLSGSSFVGVCPTFVGQRDRQ